MKKGLFLLLLVFLTGLLSSAEDSPEAFLNIVRNSSNRGTWGKMSGTVIHRRRGLPAVKASILYSILFTPSRTVAQLFFNQKELYNIGQSCKPPYDASLETKDVAEKPLLAEYGIRAEDLTMNFVYWKFRNEAPETTVRTIPCRVMDLENEKGTESIRVCFSKGYYFPLRVQWFKGPASAITGKGFRTLEITSFSRENGLWVASELSVSGPGWMSMILFHKVSAGTVKNGVPKDLFR